MVLTAADEKGRERSGFRAGYWAASVLGPVSLALAFMDIAAHSGDPKLSPMIGLEGGGAPNALPFIFVTIAFVCISGALVMRSTLSLPRPSIPGAVVLSMFVFVLTGLASRPLFQVKWRRDCAHGVAKACWAIAELSVDPASKAALLQRACDLGDSRGCETYAPTASASASAAPP